MIDNFFDATRILDIILKNRKLSHEELINFIKQNEHYFKGITKEEIKKLAFEYESKYYITISDITLTEPSYSEDISWLSQKKPNINHSFEERYKKYLQLKHFKTSVVDHIIISTEKILSLCADPGTNGKKIGLVMGDVQSGKTSNYISLINMACEYGYNGILILAGLTESLRVQTQKRIDEGFIGAISSSIGKSAKINYIGVGSDTKQHYAIPLTNLEKDFSSSPGTSDDFNKPVVLVVKKNKKILENTKIWLKPGKSIGENILIIDDECDNASVNTKDDCSPSTINLLIRDIYNNFNCATYVGYTATPFANIFINPYNDKHNDDLFPKNFIHRLDSSGDDDYFGTKKVFDNYINNTLKIINEKESNFLPVIHKKDHEYTELAESLKDAICTFLICNCIRTMRGDIKEHRSMLINISRFNNLHKSIYERVSEYVEKLRSIIQVYDQYSLEKFIRNAEMKRIYNLYINDDFFCKEKNGKRPLNKQYDFTKIKSTLFQEIDMFKICVMNNRHKNEFKYDDYKENGARIIVIGGFVLSRGLTLEGLMTSYYSRNASAYDTLLQMCRWFGYRFNYEDLCRIYMSELSIDSFAAVIDSIKNIDEQLEVMRNQGKTPSDFGLMIKESPDTLETNLLITARNKMQHTITIANSFNYSGFYIDTSKLYKSVEKNIKNIENLNKLYRDLYECGHEIKNMNDRWLFKNIPSKFIANFIKNLKIPIQNKKFDIFNLSENIGKSTKLWDVVFANGNDKTIKPFILGDGDIKIIPSLRSTFEYRDEEDFIRVSSQNNKLGQPGIFNAGLTVEGIEEAKNIAKEAGRQNPIEKDYLS